MDVFQQAHEYVSAFHVYAGDPLLSQGEAELRDLALLRDVVDEAIAAHVRELVEFEGLSWSAAAEALASSPALLRSRYGREPGARSE
ncbi:hypothetical protein [Arcanobacterium canis]